MRDRTALLAALVLVGGPALAQDTSGCAKFKWSIAREQSAFATPGLRNIDPGQPLPGVMDPAIVALQPVTTITFVQPPGRKPKDGSFGAVLKLPPIVVAGTYQVTLSDEAWIDMIQGGHEVRSSRFSGEADCPGIRKSVQFPMQQGDATMQISGSSASSIKVDFVPAQ